MEAFRWLMSQPKWIYYPTGILKIQLHETAFKLGDTPKHKLENLLNEFFVKIYRAIAEFPLRREEQRLRAIAHEKYLKQQAEEEKKRQEEQRRRSFPEKNCFY